MLNVNFNEVIGYCDYKHLNTTYKATLCKANCMFAIMVFTEDSATPVAFFSDLKHLKKCVGLLKNYDGVKDNCLTDFNNFVIDVTQKSYYGDKMSLVYETLKKAGFKCREYKPKGLTRKVNKVC